MQRIMLVFIMFILVACSPSESSIQTAIAQTQSEWTPIHTQTDFPTLTPFPTQTPLPTVIKILIQTPVPKYADTLCKPIHDVNYSTIWKSITSLQAYLGQFPDVRSTSYAVPERLYSNADSYFVNLTYVSDSDGEVYSRKYIVYITEFSWKKAIFSVDGQCWIDSPHN